MNPTRAAAILEVSGLNFSYPGEAPLLSNWSCSVGAGITRLYGDTGSGKSTVLRLLSGASPVAGRVALDGIDLNVDPVSFRRQVFLVDAATEAYQAVVARDCAAALCAEDSGFDPAVWQSLLEGFALGPHIDKPVYMLSTGSKRKLWLAAGLAAGRRLTLLDEPTAALDAASIRCLYATLSALARGADRAVIVASAERFESLPLAHAVDLPSR